MLVILSDRVCIAERIQSDGVQVCGVGGEIADIQRGDVALRVEIQPEDGEQSAGVGHCRAVQRGRTIRGRLSARNGYDGFGRAERLLIEHVVLRVHVGDLFNFVIRKRRGADDEAAVRSKRDGIVKPADIGRLNGLVGAQRARV